METANIFSQHIIQEKRNWSEGPKSSRRVDLNESSIEVRDYLKDSESTCRKTRSRSKAGNNCDLVVEGTEHLSLSKTPRQSSGSLIARDDIDKTFYSLRKKKHSRSHEVLLTLDLKITLKNSPMIKIAVVFVKSKGIKYILCRSLLHFVGNATQEVYCLDCCFK